MFFYVPAVTNFPTVDSYIFKKEENVCESLTSKSSKPFVNSKCKVIQETDSFESEVCKSKKL